MLTTDLLKIITETDADLNDHRAEIAEKLAAYVTLKKEHAPQERRLAEITAGMCAECKARMG